MTLMMEIEFACYQRLSDNISDPYLWQALCFAGALLVPLCLLHSSWLNVSCLFLEPDCKLSSHLWIPPPPHPQLHPCSHAWLHIVKQWALPVLSVSSHPDDSVETGVRTGRLLSSALCSEKEICKNGKKKYCKPPRPSDPSLILLLHLPYGLSQFSERKN